MGRVQCYTTVVDGETVTYRATEELTGEDLDAFHELMRWAIKRHEAEEAKLTPEQRAARDDRQARLRARVDRIRGGS